MSSELQQIDQLLTHDVFDALCDRGMPMPRVSEFVWPAVEALDHQVKDDSVRLWRHDGLEAPTLLLRRSRRRCYVIVLDRQGVVRWLYQGDSIRRGPTN